jgi:hypothetical protein
LTHGADIYEHCTRGCCVMINLRRVMMDKQLISEGYCAYIHTHINILAYYRRVQPNVTGFDLHKSIVAKSASC